MNKNYVIQINISIIFAELPCKVYCIGDYCCLEGFKVQEVKKLTNLLWGPLRRIVGISITICGLNIVGIIIALTTISSKKEFFDQHYEILLAALILMISLLIIGFLFITIALSIEILRIKPFKEGFDKNVVNCTQNCNITQEHLDNGEQFLAQLSEEGIHIEDRIQAFSQHLDRLEGVITGLDMAGRIINKKRLLEIEKNVHPGAEIIILSSKYKLDEEYKSLIINNIRKGVTYKYIVAGVKESSASHVQFVQIVRSWYREYQTSLDNEKGLASIRKKAKKTKISADPEKAFFDHVKEYCSPFPYNTLTIMLYQEKSGSSVYKAVVNLPAEDGYYSYVLPEKHAETNTIIDGVISMCSRDKEWNYRGPINKR